MYAILKNNSDANSLFSYITKADSVNGNYNTEVLISYADIKIRKKDIKIINDSFGSFETYLKLPSIKKALKEKYLSGSLRKKMI